MITLQPAYGRDYKNAFDARDDFESDLDFIDASWDARGTYINRAQITEGTTVSIRFNRDRSVVSFIVGHAPPKRPAKRGSNPRRFGAYYVRWTRIADDGFSGDTDEASSSTRFPSKAKAMAHARKYAGFPRTVRCEVFGEPKGTVGRESIAVIGGAR